MADERRRCFIEVSGIEEDRSQVPKRHNPQFIIAGKDTTALTLSWFLYMLYKHPPIQEKIAQEVKEATKARDASTLDDLAASITEESLDKMQYLHAALTETLRLYPPVPVVMHTYIYMNENIFLVEILQAWTI